MKQAITMACLLCVSAAAMAQDMRKNNTQSSGMNSRSSQDTTRGRSRNGSRSGNGNTDLIDNNGTYQQGVNGSSSGLGTSTTGSRSTHSSGVGTSTTGTNNVGTSNGGYENHHNNNTPTGGKKRVKNTTPRTSPNNAEH